MTNETGPRIIRPKIVARNTFPNIGLQDAIDLMDCLGFELTFVVRAKQEESKNMEIREEREKC